VAADAAEEKESAGVVGLVEAETGPRAGKAAEAG
jgi:hypothetical protein